MTESNETATALPSRTRVARSKSVIARLRPDEHARTHQAAAHLDLSVSQYCEAAIQKQNRETLEDTREAC